MVFRFMKYTFILCTVFLIASCTTTDNVGSVSFGTGIDHDWGTGGQVWSHQLSHSLSKVQYVSSQYCKKRGFGEPRLSAPAEPSFLTTEYYKYNFECGARLDRFKDAPSPTVASSPSVSESTSMEKAKQKCIDLGFKIGTESFGECILKIM